MQIAAEAELLATIFVRRVERLTKVRQAGISEGRSSATETDMIRLALAATTRTESNTTSVLLQKRFPRDARHFMR